MINTIKGKIVLWYGISVFLIVSASGIILKSTIGEMTDSIIRDRLDNAIGLVRISSLYDDTFQIYMDKRALDGVEVLIYTSDGKLLQGNAIDSIKSQKLEDEQFKTLHINNRIYYVYDELIEKKDQGQYWVRSYLVFDDVFMWSKMLRDAAIYIIPILLLSSICGGFFIARRAFNPINKMRSTVKEITDSGNLNRRIELNKKNQDELTMLADTFNEMFDKIQNILLQEKQVTSDASHELRTPVAVILAQSEYLLEQLSELENQEADQELVETTEVIIRQTKRLQKIINDLLMIARMENQKFYVEKESVNFSEMVEMIIEEMKEVAYKRNIQIKSSIPKNISLKSNETLLIRVLINLISNAIKYGRDNGWILVTVWEEESQIACSIEDNGVGIAPENLDKIWNRFYMVDKSRRLEGDSTGLGLFLVQHIVKQLEGSILVNSKIEEGSCFTLYLKSLKSMQTLQ